MSGAAELGSLVPVPLREIWRHEQIDFTPWLLENLDHLAEALGMQDLEPINREVAVGGFSLDLLARTPTGELVAIENQLEASDHGHLGQLLTYGAGVGASYVVWVCPAIREEHRAALDWLNEHTDDELGFFGVELSALRIDDSRPALQFQVRSAPNDWQKQARQVRPRSRGLKSWEEFEQRTTELSGPRAANAVRELRDHWRQLGGTESFGRDSFFPNLPTSSTRTHIWPVAFYAAGSVEVVFQHLSVRPPFDDPDLREKLRLRLNEILTTQLPADRLEKRPNFPLDELLDAGTRERFKDVLDWFVEVCRSATSSI